MWAINCNNLSENSLRAIYRKLALGIVISRVIFENKSKSILFQMICLKFYNNCVWIY